MKITIEITNTQELLQVREWLNKFPLPTEMDGTIKSLGLDVRGENSLMADNVYTVSDLMQRSKEVLLRTPNLGRKHVNQVIEKLRERGLELPPDTK